MPINSHHLCIILVGILFIHSVKGQIQLADCHEKAINHFPLSAQKNLIDQSLKYSLEAAAKGYIPQVSLSAKGSYQSNVTSIPITIPGVTIPTLNKDQYQAVAEVYQPIYDGGTYSWQQKEAKATAIAEAKQLDITLFTLRERVNQLFFGLLLIQEQINLNKLLNDELLRNQQKIETYIANGTANTIDRDRISVEIINHRQRKAELKANEQTYRLMLSLFIGEEIDEQTTLERPTSQYQTSQSLLNRPEITLFEAQNRLLETQHQKIQSSYLPRIGLFVQGGIGNPALNMFQVGFEPFYIAGLRLSWSLSGLYTKSNQSNLIRTKQKTVELQQKTFIFNTQIQIKQHSGEIEKLDQLLREDDEIIALRQRISQAGEAKVANGIQSIADHLKEINETDQARANKVLHEIQKLMAIYQLKNSTNDY